MSRVVIIKEEYKMIDGEEWRFVTFDNGYVKKYKTGYVER